MTGGVRGRLALGGSPEYPQKELYSTDWANFQPRLGLAYALTSKTVLRAGGGIIFQGLSGLSSVQSSFYSGSLEFSQVPTLDGQRWVSELGTEHGLGAFPRQADGSLLGVHQPVRSNKEFWYSTYGGCASLVGCSAIPTHVDSPQEYSWVASIQSEVAKRWLLTADYTGIRGIHLLNWQSNVGPSNLNPIYYSLGDNLRMNVPNPFYGQSQNFVSQTIPLYRLLTEAPHYSTVGVANAPWGKAMSQSLNLQAETRSFHGLTLIAAYSIRKTLTNTSGKEYWNSGALSTIRLHNPNDFMEAYAVASYEVPQTALLVYAYDLPFGKGRQFMNSTRGIAGKILNAVAGGWGVAGFTKWAPKGTPVWGPQVSGGRRAPGPVALRWSVKPGVDYLNPDVDLDSAIVMSGKFVYNQPKTRYNKDAFLRTPNYSFGNIPVIYPNVRQPGFFETDATFMKDFRLPGRESRYFSFRMEAQNLFNHPNFGSFNSNPDSPTFGGVNGKSGERLIQLGLRLFF